MRNWHINWFFITTFWEAFVRTFVRIFPNLIGSREYVINSIMKAESQWSCCISLPSWHLEMTHPRGESKTFSRTHNYSQYESLLTVIIQGHFAASETGTERFSSARQVCMLNFISIILFLVEGCAVLLSGDFKQLLPIFDHLSTRNPNKYRAGQKSGP